MHQFSDKTNNVEILGPNLPRIGFWSRNFKNLILDSESTPPLYHVYQFSVKIDNIWFFDLCYIVNGIIDHHHCTRDIPGTRFPLIGSVHILCNQVGRGGERGGIIENSDA